MKVRDVTCIDVGGPRNFCAVCRYTCLKYSTVVGGAVSLLVPP